MQQENGKWKKKQLRFKLSFFAIARLGEVDIKLQLVKTQKNFLQVSGQLCATFLISWPGTLFKKHRLFYFLFIIIILILLLLLIIFI